MTSTFDRLEPEMAQLLGDLLRTPSVSGHEGPLTRFVADYLRWAGLAIDLWQSTEADVAGRHPAADGRHLPLAGRPTLVATVRGTGGGRSLLFNAHADTVDAGDVAAWTHPPFGGVSADGRVYGRGACDVKGPLASAIWAMLTLAADPPAGDVSLELVPGEEDCVMLGTLTSVARGHSADGLVVLEPTEGLPRNASRPGVRFEITAHGRAVHGTVKWLGVDAIAIATRVIATVSALECEWNDTSADALYAMYPISRPITIDTVRGGQWQGMVCDKCLIAGYLDLLPGDDTDDWRDRLTAAVHQNCQGEDHVNVTFPEVYSGHHTTDDDELCRAADATVRSAGLAWPGWAGFNAGCEAGLRANLLGTPSLVWGPGSLAEAHAADEFVAWDEVRQTAGLFADFARRWSDGA